MGIAAIDLLMNEQTGKAVGIKENKIINVDFDKVNIESGNKLGNYHLLETILN